VNKHVTKALADYSAAEALAEIQSLVNVETAAGSRVDQLAGQLMLLALNAETSRINERQHLMRINSQGAKALYGLSRLLADTHGRKTVRRDAVDDIYRSATS
jgi:DNA polymerase III delta prime subunit